MTDNGSPKPDAAELREVARQVQIELAILLGIEQAIRVALQWMTRDRGNRHKLSTLRHHAGTFEQHFSRIHALADHGGYLEGIKDSNPHLVREVVALREERSTLHSNLARIIVGLDRVSSSDAEKVQMICDELSRFLDALRSHGERESDLLQRSFTQEEGGSG